MTCHCPTDAVIRDALTALVASVRAAERERIAVALDARWDVESDARDPRDQYADGLLYGLDIAATIARTEPTP